MNALILPQRRATGFTLMELLVVVGVILVLVAVVLPIYRTAQQKAGKVQAMRVMQQLGSATQTFAAMNGNALPGEGSSSQNSWSYATDPANSKCWINALPRILKKKGAADFAANPEAFYTSDNLLYLPIVTYPTGQTKLTKPLFAIGMNSKLERNAPKGGGGVVANPGPVLLSQISNPSRTVLFLERGLPTEKEPYRAMPSYDGAPKARFNAFVARDSGFGTVTFVDGHAESVTPSEVTLPDGRTPFPPQKLIWCRTPEENPN